MDAVLPPFPQTLLEWRMWCAHTYKIAPRQLWNQYEEFFRGQGFILWKHAYTIRQIPPNDNPRCPDPYAYRLPTCDTQPSRGRFDATTPISCAARTLDDRDVIIRLIVKGEDGLNHLEALKRLSTGYMGSRGENHAIPVFKFIHLEDMTFAVIPLMAGGYYSEPWYRTIGEVYDAVEQVLEGVACMHDNLVAHLVIPEVISSFAQLMLNLPVQDLDRDNILTNFCAGSLEPRQPPAIPPFRSLFPVRYYINDFELAVCFDKDSDPATRLITGIPPHRIGRVGEYGRDMAPEFVLDKPYCPFKADIWQLGTMFYYLCDQISALPDELKKLFSLMADDNPSTRPSASEALLTFRSIRRKTSIATLLEAPEEAPPRWIPDDPIVSL